MHGGTVRRGIASPNFRTGRYSREMPTRLADRFHQAENDPTLLSARSDVALLYVRISELISQLHTGESGSIWAGLRTAYAAVEEAIADRDLAGLIEGFQEMGNFIKAGSKEEATWHELAKAIQDKTRVAEREHRRLRDMHQMITAEQAQLLFHAVVGAIEKHIADRAVRAAIGVELEQLLTDS